MNFFLSVVCGLCILAGLHAERSVVKQLGPAIVISPNPETYVDPLLSILPEAMDEFFQQPYYPFPDLSFIAYTSKFFLAGSLAINPLDDKIMHLSIGQNFIYDVTQWFRPMFPSNTFATSRDGGRTWKYGPPIEQIIPLGGKLSQLVNASQGPGLAYTYTKEGELYAYGNGYFDLHPNPPNTVPTTGFLFTSSKNEGRTWRKLNKVLVSDVDWWFQPLSPYNAGLGPREFYLTPDPANPDHIHAITSFVLQPGFAHGSAFYFYSKDGGKTFSTPVQVYNLVDDPVWFEKYFDPYYPDPRNFAFGGLVQISDNPVVFDDNTILIPVLRRYPIKGSPIYNFGLDTFRVDHAFIRSEDNGKTWEKVAGATDQSLLTINSVYDPGGADITQEYLINGVLIFLFAQEGCFSCAPSFQSASPLVSPYTGRLYTVSEANNPAFGLIEPFFRPTANCLLLSVSSDKGKTFTPSVKINRTPTDIQMGAQQAFSHNVIFTKDGHLAVAYYDFRNWTGFPGELKLPPFNNTDENMPPLQMDAWLDIYKEVDDPKGGSTGVGLDFVEEIRLTPESFNARLVFKDSPTVPFFTATNEGIPLALNSNNVLHVIYSVTVPGKGSVTPGYKNMLVNTNTYFELYMKKFQFPKPSNQ